MAPINAQSFDEKELKSNLQKLKAEKLRSGDRLDLLRAVAGKSEKYILTFDKLEDTLIDLSRQLSDIEEIEVNLPNLKLNEVENHDEGREDEARKGLKRSMALMADFGSVSKGIMRLGIRLEDEENNEGSEALPTTLPAEPGSVFKAKKFIEPNKQLLTTPQVGSRRSKRKKQLVSYAESDSEDGGREKNSAAKKEDFVPKRKKEKKWAPNGYHVVDEHFRRNPKKKGKRSQAVYDGPATFAIVRVD